MQRTLVVKPFLGILLLISLVQGCTSTTPTKPSANQLIDAFARAERSYDQGLLSDAEQQYRQITLSHPDYYEAWFKLGNIYTRTDQLPAAVLAYEECTRREPEELRCWNNLAIARLKQSIQVLEQGKSQLVAGSPGYEMLDALYTRLVATASQ